MTHLVPLLVIVVYLVALLRRPDLPRPPRLVLAAVAATIAVSLAFDYVDTARYLLGERMPVPGTAPAG